MTIDEIVDDLVCANGILYAEGVVDGFGHVSARHPSDLRAFSFRAAWRPRSA